MMRHQVNSLFIFIPYNYLKIQALKIFLQKPVPGNLQEAFGNDVLRLLVQALEISVAELRLKIRGFVEVPQ